MLYPSMTTTRSVYDLCGIWDFTLGDTLPHADGWQGKRLPNPLPMPVPSAYNDLYEGRGFRDHVGDVIYQRTLIVPPLSKSQCALLRFGSVTHRADVYLNDTHIFTHRGGFLPFEIDITDAASPGENLLTVLVNNIVDETTLPAGRIEVKNIPGLPAETRNLPNFDFYNYSGIMRPVKLLVVPKNRIEDITIVAHADGAFSCTVQTTGSEGSVEATIKDKAGRVIASLSGRETHGKAEGVIPWSPGTPEMYTLHIRYVTPDSTDEYTESFGFRDVEIRDCRLYLNGKPIYLKGFGKHEDSPINGRGLNEVYNVKDLSLMRWMHANSMRTSHYPYSEEMMRLCDREGILVIDEAPAVGLHTGFTATGLLGGIAQGTWELFAGMQPYHLETMRDLISRDKNHPCVIMWSVANEPASEEEGAKEYFAPLVSFTRDEDPQHRPVTIVTYGGSTPETCKVAELVDVLVINRYYGWYTSEADLPAAGQLLYDELERFHQRYPDKPIMLGEYGADTIAGMHDSTPGLFSEEFQVEFLKTYSRVFDQCDYITGEHVWNFADFATAENIKRVQGNKKGVFTRERKPKMAAHFLKSRWEELE